MTKCYYIQISPRGFANEAQIFWGTREEVAEANERINNDVNAWATPLAASHAAVRAAKAYAAKWGEDIARIGA